MGHEYIDSKGIGQRCNQFENSFIIRRKDLYADTLFTTWFVWRALHSESYVTPWGFIVVGWSKVKSHSVLTV